MASVLRSLANQERSSMSGHSADSITHAPNVSLFRLYAIRLLFLLNFVILGLDVWPALFDTSRLHEPVAGVALSFWAALSTLSFVGLIHPLRMVPLLFVQLCYKTVWLLAIALPLHNAAQWTPATAEIFKACAIGLVLDILVIPWSYAFGTFVRTKGDRWRSGNA